MFVNYKSTVIDKDNFLKDIKRGDEIFIVGVQRYTLSTRTTVKVISKGTKYITVNLHGRDIKFHALTGMESSVFTPAYSIYPSEKSFKDLEAEYKAFNETMAKVKVLINNESNFTLAKAKQLLEVLQNEY